MGVETVGALTGGARLRIFHSVHERASGQLGRHGTSVVPFVAVPVRKKKGPAMTESVSEPARIISINERTATVQASGEIDTATSQSLRSCLTNCLRQGCSEITVDMSDLEFIDSSGIQVLVWTLKEIRALEGQLIIQNPPSMAEKVLAISGITPYLEFTYTRPRETVRPDDTL